jgi:hypothetical protein
VATEAVDAVPTEALDDVARGVVRPPRVAGRVWRLESPRELESPVERG